MPTKLETHIQGMPTKLETHIQARCPTRTFQLSVKQCLYPLPNGVAISIGNSRSGTHSS